MVKGVPAMRSIHLLAGALAFLCCDTTEAVSRTGQASATTPGFVIGFGSTAAAATRKRPRGYCSTTPTAATTWSSRPVSAVDVQIAAAGSFTARSGGRGGWFGASTGERSRQNSCGAGNAELCMGIQFNPPEWNDLAHGFAQAVLLGIMGGTVPRLTKDRIREKEAGLDVDDRFEMGLDRDDDDEDEFGYGQGYVCATCDNTNEVECGQCRGKGFFVSESALPKKCGYCAGLGTMECQECSERREMLRQERGRRTPPLRLPPSRDEDFPFDR